MTEYEEFIAKKSQLHVPTGFEISAESLNPALMDFQKAVVLWALRRGRAAIFGDTGNGKTVMQSEWAKHVAAHEDGQIIIAAPLAVAQQTIEMAKKLLDIDIGYARNMRQITKQITITNYEMIGEFDLSQFAGIVPDE